MRLSSKGVAALSVLVAGSSAMAAPPPSNAVVIALDVDLLMANSRAVPLGPDQIAGEPDAPVVGLLLPAVQKVREAAARMKSQNNLRQIAIATLDPSDTGAVPGPFTLGGGGAFHLGAQHTAPAIGAPVIRRATALLSARAFPSADGSPTTVRVIPLEPGSTPTEFLPFGTSYSGGVSIATGDVTGDGVDDIIVGGGPGSGPHIKVFDGVTGAELARFKAGSELSKGVNVAVGDLDGDGAADLIVGQDRSPGAGGPRVKIYRMASVLATGPGTPGTPDPVLDALFTLDLPGNFATGGVHVAAGDLDGDGRAELIANAFGTPVPGATNFAPRFYSALGGGSVPFSGFAPLPIAGNPFGSDYFGGIVALTEELDGSNNGREIVFTAFSGFIPEPTAALLLPVAGLMLGSRRRR